MLRMIVLGIKPHFLHKVGKGKGVRKEMRLFIDLKKMTLDDDIEYNIINGIVDKEFLGYDIAIDIPDDDKFIQDTIRIIYKKDQDGKDTDEIELRYFIIKEQETWFNFPIYQLKDGKIEDFDYTQFIYFPGTDRRVALADKISRTYNAPSEIKMLRKTLKMVLDHLQIVDDDFQKYNDKVESIINGIPKN